MSYPNVRVPPDSTGKRVATKTTLEVNYTNLTGDLEIGDAVTLSTSGYMGIISHVKEDTGTTGEMYIELDHESPEVVVNGETFTAVGRGAAGAGTISGTGTVYHTTKTVQYGANNSFYGQYVDRKGAGYVRFVDGAPTLNAFGSLLTAEATTVGAYEFSADPADDLFSDITGSGGTVTYFPLLSSVDLEVGTASGSIAERTSNKYHFYWPARGLGVIMTVANSDTGVTGNVRRWGLFDDNDGVFFELSGSIMNVVIRSSVAGVLTERRVPQSDWNIDKLDGNGVSREVLHPDKILPYLIDYQWLGAGRVRFGIVGKDGARVYCHLFENAGLNDYVYMTRGSLPIRVANRNFALIGTTPSIRFTCAVVQNEGVTDYTYWRYAYQHDPKTINADKVPIMGIQSKLFFEGKHNQTNAYPQFYNCFVNGTGVIRLDFYWPITLNGATWALDNGSTIEADVAATTTTIDDSSALYHTEYLTAGKHNIDLQHLFELNDEGILTPADDAKPSVPFCLVGTLISGSATTIEGTITYRELR